jgi:polyribonucleotide nucleotidyltransferase
MIYLAATYGVLRGVSDCLNGVNMILREIVEMRNLIEQLAKKTNSTSAIEILETDNKNKLGNDIRSLAEKLVDENYKGDDQARKNELKNAVDAALKTIARKVSEGSKLELKYLAPQRPSTQEGAEEVEADRRQTEQEALALRLEREISLIDFSGSKNHVLGLLENESTEAEQMK